jgi:hypothetical protein
LLKDDAIYLDGVNVSRLRKVAAVDSGRLPLRGAAQQVQPAVADAEDAGHLVSVAAGSPTRSVPPPRSPREQATRKLSSTPPPMASAN